MKLRAATLALALGGLIAALAARKGEWSQHASPVPAAAVDEQIPETAVAPSVPDEAEEPGGAPPAHDPVELFDSDEVTRLLDFLLDPANQKEEHVEERSCKGGELAAIVERGGLPFVREALRRMQDPVRDQRRRAQLLLALAKNVPAELLEDLRASADPLVFAYPDLRDAAPLGPDTKGDGGTLGDAPLLDVAEEVRVRLWPDSGTQVATDQDVRSRLSAWWKEIPAEDRFLAAEDELIVVARDVAKVWFNHRWRFVMVLKRLDGRWRAVSYFQPERDGDRFERVVVGDFDGDGRKEAAVWILSVGGWTWSRLVVVGDGAPEGVMTKWVYGGCGEIKLVPPRWPGDPTRFGTCDVYLPGNTGHWGYCAGVIARECSLLEWTGTGLRSVGSVWIPFGS